MPQQKAQHDQSQQRRRRTHRKSRQGCEECKSRHIKCDENRPHCTNCTVSERTCIFPKIKSPQPDSATRTSKSSRKTDRVVTSSQEPQAPPSSGCFTVMHMVFLHHAETSMTEYMALPGDARAIIDIAIGSTSSAPFLLDQLLALAALHLSTKDVSDSALYHQQATELQTRALQSFNQSKSEMSSANCMPPFLFASLVGFHILRDTLGGAHDSLSSFTEAFVSYLYLHRGVRTFIHGDAWNRILKSNLGPLLFIDEASRRVEHLNNPGMETNRLKTFLESDESGFHAVDACLGALKWVQWMLDIANLDPKNDALGIHATMAWPLVVPPEYIEALHQRRPEAFAVLAFYAVALYRYRRFWVFGNAGEELFGRISTYLGSYWLQHLDLCLDE